MAHGSQDGAGDCERAFRSVIACRLRGHRQAGTTEGQPPGSPGRDGAGQQRRSSSRKKVIRIGIIVVLALVAAFGLSRLIGAGRRRRGRRFGHLAGHDSAPRRPSPARPSPARRRARRRTAPPHGRPASRTRRPCASTPPRPTPRTSTPARAASRSPSTPRRPPQTVNNFVVLSRYHFYDGITFHRIVPGFVVQGGDPTGTGGGGPGYEFADELPASMEDYKAGSVAMANSGPGHQRQPVLRHPRPTPGSTDPSTRSSARSRRASTPRSRRSKPPARPARSPTITKVTITES